MRTVDGASDKPEKYEAPIIANLNMLVDVASVKETTGEYEEHHIVAAQEEGEELEFSIADQKVVEGFNESVSLEKVQHPTILRTEVGDSDLPEKDKVPLIANIEKFEKNTTVEKITEKHEERDIDIHEKDEVGEDSVIDPKLVVSFKKSESPGLEKVQQRTVLSTVVKDSDHTQLRESSILANLDMSIYRTVLEKAPEEFEKHDIISQEKDEESHVSMELSTALPTVDRYSATPDKPEVPVTAKLDKSISAEETTDDIVVHNIVKQEKNEDIDVSTTDTKLVKGLTESRTLCLENVLLYNVLPIVSGDIDLPEKHELPVIANVEKSKNIKAVDKTTEELDKQDIVTHLDEVDEDSITDLTLVAGVKESESRSVENVQQPTVLSIIVRDSDLPKKHELPLIVKIEKSKNIIATDKTTEKLVEHGIVTHEYEEVDEDCITESLRLESVEPINSIKLTAKEPEERDIVLEEKDEEIVVLTTQQKVIEYLKENAGFILENLEESTVVPKVDAASDKSEKHKPSNLAKLSKSIDTTVVEKTREEFKKHDVIPKEKGEKIEVSITVKKWLDEGDKEREALSLDNAELTTSPLTVHGASDKSEKHQPWIIAKLQKSTDLTTVENTEEGLKEIDIVTNGEGKVDEDSIRDEKLVAGFKQSESHSPEKIEQPTVLLIVRGADNESEKREPPIIEKFEKSIEITAAEGTIEEFEEHDIVAQEKDEEFVVSITDQKVVKGFNESKSLSLLEVEEISVTVADTSDKPEKHEPPIIARVDKSENIATIEKQTQELEKHSVVTHKKDEVYKDSITGQKFVENFNESESLSLGKFEQLTVLAITHRAGDKPNKDEPPIREKFEKSIVTTDVERTAEELEEHDLVAQEKSNEIVVSISGQNVVEGFKESDSLSLKIVEKPTILPTIDRARAKPEKHKSPIMVKAERSVDIITVEKAKAELEENNIFANEKEQEIEVFNIGQNVVKGVNENETLILEKVEQTTVLRRVDAGSEKVEQHDSAVIAKLEKSLDIIALEITKKEVEYETVAHVKDEVDKDAITDHKLVESFQECESHSLEKMEHPTALAVQCRYVHTVRGASDNLEKHDLLKIAKIEDSIIMATAKQTSLGHDVVSPEKCEELVISPTNTKLNEAFVKTEALISPPIELIANNVKDCEPLSLINVDISDSSQRVLKPALVYSAEENVGNKQKRSTQNYTGQPLILTLASTNDIHSLPIVGLELVQDVERESIINEQLICESDSKSMDLNLQSVSAPIKIIPHESGTHSDSLASSYDSSISVSSVKLIKLKLSSKDENFEDQSECKRTILDIAPENQSIISSHTSSSNIYLDTKSALEGTEAENDYDALYTEDLVSFVEKSAISESVASSYGSSNDADTDSLMSRYSKNTSIVHRRDPNSSKIKRLEKVEPSLKSNSETKRKTNQLISTNLLTTQKPHVSLKKKFITPSKSKPERTTSNVRSSVSATSKILKSSIASRAGLEKITSIEASDKAIKYTKTSTNKFKSNNLSSTSILKTQVENNVRSKAEKFAGDENIVPMRKLKSERPKVEITKINRPPSISKSRIPQLQNQSLLKSLKVIVNKNEDKGENKSKKIKADTIHEKIERNPYSYMQSTLSRNLKIGESVCVMQDNKRHSPEKNKKDTDNINARAKYNAQDLHQSSLTKSYERTTIASSKKIQQKELSPARSIETFDSPKQSSPSKSNVLKPKQVDINIINKSTKSLNEDRVFVKKISTPKYSASTRLIQILIPSASPTKLRKKIRIEEHVVNKDNESNSMTEFTRSQSAIPSIRRDRITDDGDYIPKSLPGSPIRTKSANGTRSGTELITSEVFTSHADTGSIEVVYRQPYENMKKIGGRMDIEMSLIDTTDSSLSESVALPSSPSDHELSADTNIRIKASSPVSPKLGGPSLQCIQESEYRFSDLHICDDSISLPPSDFSQCAEVIVVSSLVSKVAKEHCDIVERSVTTAYNNIPVEALLSPILDVESRGPSRRKHKFSYVQEKSEAQGILESGDTQEPILEQAQEELHKPDHDEDSKMGDPEDISYESALLTETNRNYPLHSSFENDISYNQIDLMLEKMLMEAEQHQQFYKTELEFDDALLSKSCLSEVQLVPSSSALIEIPIQKEIISRSFESISEIEIIDENLDECFSLVCFNNAVQPKFDENIYDTLSLDSNSGTDPPPALVSADADTNSCIRPSAKLDDINLRWDESSNDEECDYEPIEAHQFMTLMPSGLDSTIYKEDYLDVANRNLSIVPEEDEDFSSYTDSYSSGNSNKRRESNISFQFNSRPLSLKIQEVKETNEDESSSLLIDFSKSKNNSKFQNQAQVVVHRLLIRTPKSSENSDLFNEYCKVESSMHPLNISSSPSSGSSPLSANSHAFQKSFEYNPFRDWLSGKQDTEEAVETKLSEDNLDGKMLVNIDKKPKMSLLKNIKAYISKSFDSGRIKKRTLFGRQISIQVDSREQTVKDTEEKRSISEEEEMANKKQVKAKAGCYPSIVQGANILVNDIITKSEKIVNTSSKSVSGDSGNIIKERSISVTESNDEVNFLNDCINNIQDELITDEYMPVLRRKSIVEELIDDESEPLLSVSYFVAEEDNDCMFFQSPEAMNHTSSANNNDSYMNLYNPIEDGYQNLNDSVDFEKKCIPGRVYDPNESITSDSKSIEDEENDEFQMTVLEKLFNNFDNEESHKEINESDTKDLNDQCQEYDLTNTNQLSMGPKFKYGNITNTPLETSINIFSQNLKKKDSTIINDKEMILTNDVFSDDVTNEGSISSNKRLPSDYTTVHKIKQNPIKFEGANKLEKNVNNYDELSQNSSQTAQSKEQIPSEDIEEVSLLNMSKNDIDYMPCLIFDTISEKNTPNENPCVQVDQNCTNLNTDATCNAKIFNESTKNIDVTNSNIVRYNDIGNIMPHGIDSVTQEATGRNITDLEYKIMYDLKEIMETEPLLCNLDDNEELPLVESEDCDSRYNPEPNEFKKPLYKIIYDEEDTLETEPLLNNSCEVLQEIAKVCNVITNSNLNHRTLDVKLGTSREFGKNVVYNNNLIQDKSDVSSQSFDSTSYKEKLDAEENVPIMPHIEESPNDLRKEEKSISDCLRSSTNYNNDEFSCLDSYEKNIAGVAFSLPTCKDSIIHEFSEECYNFFDGYDALLQNKNISLPESITEHRISTADILIKGDVIYMGPITFNEKRSINRAGVEVTIIPIGRSPSTSPPQRKKELSQSNIRTYSSMNSSVSEKSNSNSCYPHLTLASSSLTPTPKPRSTTKIPKTIKTITTVQPVQFVDENNVPVDLESTGTIEPESENYYGRKKFWESKEQQDEIIELKKRFSLRQDASEDITSIVDEPKSMHEASIEAPTPKRRSSASILRAESKSSDREKSEFMEEDIHTPPVTEYEAAFKDPTLTTTTACETSTQNTLQKENSADSDIECSGQFNVSSGYDNTGYISDSGDVEHYISDSEIEDRVPQIRERQMSVFQPSITTKKNICMRSASLPTEDMYEVSADSIKLRKQYYEEQIRKEMVEEQMMTEIEEEDISQEHKTLEIKRELDEPSGVKSVPETTHDDEYYVLSKSKIEIENRLEQMYKKEMKDEAIFLESDRTDVSYQEKNVDDDQNLREESIKEILENIYHVKSDISKPSDSLEVHVDKSEIEDSEKMIDLDQDATDIDTKSLDSTELSPKTIFNSDIIISRSIDARVLSPIRQPIENIQTTLWEAPIHIQGTFDEKAIDILVEKPPGHEKDDELSVGTREESDLGSEIHQDHSDSYSSDRIKSDSHDIEKLILESLHHQKISPEDAQIIANELIADIEIEIQRRHSIPIDIAEPPAPEYAKNQISEYLQHLAEAKGLDSREIELVQSVLARKHRELTKLSRDDTQASSMEITDEELRYSGADYSPSGSRVNILEQQIDQLKAEKVSEVDLKSFEVKLEKTTEATKTTIIEEDESLIDISSEDKRKVYSVPTLFNVETVAQVIKEIEPLKMEIKRGVEFQIGDEKIIIERKEIDQSIPIHKEISTVVSELTNNNGSDSSPITSPVKNVTDRISDVEAALPKRISDVDTSSSSSNRKSHRKSGLEVDTYSSSGESHYHSFELDSGKSRPCSSDVEVLVAAGSSEYESALASQETSSKSQMTSAEYVTAVSSLSSKESMKSLDSESSGNLASVEVSEASETLVASELEFTGDMPKDSLSKANLLLLRQTTDDSELDIDIRDSPDISDDDLLDEKNIQELSSKMKRSHEMNFPTERKSPQMDQVGMDDKLGTSMDDGSVLSVSLSSTSSLVQTRTVIENIHSDQQSFGSLASLEDVTGRSDLMENQQSPALSAINLSTSTKTSEDDIIYDSITLLTSTVEHEGIQSVCTQVTSATDLKQDDYKKFEQKIPEIILEPKKKCHRRNESTSGFTPEKMVFPKEKEFTLDAQESSIRVRRKSEESDIAIELKKMFSPDIIDKHRLDKRDSHTKSSSTSSERSSFEEAEAEAAFNMVAHISPVHKMKQICPIIEDETAEKNELEAREQVEREIEKNRTLNKESAAFIPDIKVTQHMAPMDRDGFRYPDLEVEEKDEEESQNTTPQTPASISSKSSDSTDQGREYILEDSRMSIIDESEGSQSVDDRMIESKSETATVIDRTICETDKETESPGSDSFELVEKPDIIDDFVVIEEVAKEAQETDAEGKSLKIAKQKHIKKHDIEVEQYLIKSAPSNKLTNIQYYPQPQRNEELGFEFEESPPQANGKEQQATKYVQEFDKELEENKKWIEQQFLGDQASMVAAGFGYEMDFERGPLEDIKEEDATDFDSSRIGSMSSHKESGGSLGSVKDSYSSTPEYDVLAGRKYFTKSGENDDVSMSSLQEFENLERAMSLENRKFHQGSHDSSSNGSFKNRHSGRSGAGDDVSVSSLKEFEGLEKACIAAHTTEQKVKEEEAILSQIDECQESIISETGSYETFSGTDKKLIPDSDEEDYEKRMFEIDEIIRQAQTNVEHFIDFKEGERTESIGRGDSVEEVSKVPDLDFDLPIRRIPTKKVAYPEPDDLMITSTDSLDVKVEKQLRYNSSDSLDAEQKIELMTDSTDSIEFYEKQLARETLSTDSVDIKIVESDSLDLAAAIAQSTQDSESIDEDGSRIGYYDHSTSSTGKDYSLSTKEDIAVRINFKDTSEFMLESCDSIASTSTATYAHPYDSESIYSGSCTSGDSNTMVSSTDTIDPIMSVSTEVTDASIGTRKIWFDEDTSGAGKVYRTEYYDDGARFHVVEAIEKEPEGSIYSHAVRRTVEMPPQIVKMTFSGSDAQIQLEKYMESLTPGESVEETEEVDADGNVHIKRVVKKTMIMTDIKELPEGQGLISRTLTDEHGSKTIFTQSFDLGSLDQTMSQKSIAGMSSQGESSKMIRSDEEQKLQKDDPSNSQTEARQIKDQQELSQEMKNILTALDEDSYK